MRCFLAPRANWKGFLKVAELVCPVALYSATSTSDRIALHTINRTTGHKARRTFLDSETRSPVEKEDQVKGYEVAKGEYIILEPEETQAVIPQSDKTISVSDFVRAEEIDDLFLDKPYYIAPSKEGEDVFNLINEGLRSSKTAAIGRAVLFRRLRTLLIRPFENGLIGTTLRFDYEVRSAKEAFDEAPAIKVTGEMMQLAQHIISTKMGKFDPSKFEDRYEAALADLVQAKIDGRLLPDERRAEKIVSLMDALRESAGLTKDSSAATTKTQKQRTTKTQHRREQSKPSTGRQRAS